ncbi:uncharacterized protein [Chironomus tepperi]|uniref:uncharacterized protein n=1 Tax=Chironomus tepperi TaxID=113505 RepID=UPI00391F1FD0
MEFRQNFQLTSKAMTVVLIQKMEANTSKLVCSLNYAISWNLISSRSDRINIHNKMSVWMEFNPTLHSIVLRLLVIDRSFFQNFPGEIKIEYCVSIGPLPSHQLQGSFFISNSTPFNGGLVVGKVQNPSLLRQITTKINVKLIKQANLSRLIDVETNTVVPRCNFNHVDLNNPEYSDFTIVFDAHKFKVHKIVLALCSGFFKSLFETIEYDEEYKDMTTYYCTHTEEFNHFHFEVMLNFIYTRKLEACAFGPYFFVELHKLAVFYQIEDLKTLCLYNVEKTYRELLHSEIHILKIYKYAVECGLKELANDCWFLIKFGMLRIFDKLKEEPLPYDEITKQLQNKMSKS